ncbi:MAG: hypothetical protein ACOCYN_05205, partial [Planctomycetota bacterium]
PDHPKQSAPTVRTHPPRSDGLSAACCVRTLSYLRWILLCALAATPLLAADRDDGAPKLSTDEQARLAEAMSGTFDMSTEPRPFVTLLILDQKGNKHPSFWVGTNKGGELTFAAKADMLEDELVLKQSGEMIMGLRQTAYKWNMEDVLPGGAWMPDLKERNFTISLDTVTDTRMTAIRKGHLFVDIAAGGAAGKDARLITMVGRGSGEIRVDDRRARWEGELELTFLDSVTMFSVKAVFPLPGKELGLEGERAEGITATIYSASTPMVSKPDIRLEDSAGLIPLGHGLDVDEIEDELGDDLLGD